MLWSTYMGGPVPVVPVAGASRDQMVGVGSLKADARGLCTGVPVREARERSIGKGIAYGVQVCLASAPGVL